jgi:ABC-type lipoprotein export system ATPase subunit
MNMSWLTGHNGNNGKNHPVHHNGEALIELRQVEKVYKNVAGGYTALKGIDLAINRGELVGIIGKSGSGKSTLINMITGIDRPTCGEVVVGDTPVHALNENQMARWRGKNLGIVFQFFQLLPTLSVIENVMLPMDFCNTFSTRERRKRALSLLEMVDMAGHASKLPSALSGGQQQRVAIARALANDPPLIIADEPTGNLDSKTADAVFKLFEALTAEGKTVVMVTHDSGLAQRVARTVLIADGEVINEFVVKAMPSLSPELMLAASHKAQTVHFAAGETILQQNAPSDNFYIITRGVAEVNLKGQAGVDVVASRMGPGQYFGLLSLFNSKRTVAGVRAMADAPLEALALDGGTFQSLLDESPAFREAMQSVVSSRLAHYRSVAEGKA